MTRKLTGFWILALLLSVVAPQLSHAITINVPQTVVAGQPVAITVQGVMQSGSPQVACNIELDFGDNTQTVTSPTCALSAACGFTTTHTYQNPGTYTLRAYGGDTCAPGAFTPDPAVRTITVGDLKVQRIDIYFNNRLPKTNVNQYQRDLRAFTEIRYTGSGLLQGQWEIDGRLFFKVRKQLHHGQQKVILQTPLAPPLPTYAVGSHQVRFVITRPDVALEAPKAIYFVTAEPDKFKPAILLAEPANNHAMACAATTFRWETPGPVYVYLVEFIQEGQTEPNFAAYAKESAYTLREDVCRSLFSAGRTYRWRVKGLSQEGQIIAQSEAFSLILKPAQQ